MRLRFSFLYVALIVLTLGVIGCNPTGGEDDDDGIDIGLPPPLFHEFPRWSPDGNTVLYYHSGLQLYDPSNGLSIHDPDSAGIWAMSPEGKNQRKILNAGYADWSPDGEWIVYVAGAQIFKVRFNGTSVDTSTVEQLTFEGRNFFPDWSPDGEWIAYDRSLDDETGPAGIWIMKQDGEKKESIFGGAFPDWHPNDEQIIGTIGTSSTSVWKRFKIYTIHDGSTEILDAVVDANNLYPKYSPHGRSIVFSSNVQIWTMNEDGKGLTQLTFDEGGTMPDWSHDGKQIIYMGPKGTIWVMDADGSNQTSLTARPEGSIN